ncbi:MAG: hypothetical protein JW819_13910 [Candidatus Krumholzibacteriota bacterium]|nr:hypothetical protein [Candidatus Krumholzibacteriota bacterium]
MKRKRQLELMHGEIDGVNSPDESRELEACLSADPALRREYKELCELARVMAVAREQEPPAALRNMILDATVRRSAAEGPRRSFWRGLLDYRWNLRVAYAVAAIVVVIGAVAVLLSYHGGDADLLPRDALFGTLGAERQAAGGECLELSATGVSGEVWSRSEAGWFVVDLEIDSRTEVQMQCVVPEALRFSGYSPEKAIRHGLQVRGGIVHLTHQGSNRYRLFFADPTATAPAAILRITAGDSTLFEGTVPVHAD